MKGLVCCSHPSLENQNAHSMPIQCPFNAHCRVITTTVQPVFSLTLGATVTLSRVSAFVERYPSNVRHLSGACQALVRHFGLPFLFPFSEFFLRVLMGFSRHGVFTYCVVHVVVHGAFTGPCFAERRPWCLTSPMGWGEDVGGRLRDSDAGYVEECRGLLGCFEGDELARGGSMRLQDCV